MEFNCRTVDLVVIDLACLAPSYERGGVGFHGEPVITQVNDLFEKPRGPFMVAIVSCMGLLKNLGQFITYDVPERCLLQPLLNRWPPSIKSFIVIRWTSF